MITCFFFCFAHIASVRHPLSPLSKLILSQYLSTSCFSSNKASSYRSSRVPNYTIREGLRSPTCQGGVEGLNRKIIFFCLQSKHNIINTRRDGVIMQLPKKGIQFLQLPVIELNRVLNLRPQLPPSQTSTTHPRRVRSLPMELEIVASLGAIWPS